MKIESQLRLLETLHSVQSQFIDDAEPQAVFENQLGHLLSFSGSDYGFIGEVITPRTGSCFLKTLAASHISWDERSQSFLTHAAPKSLDSHKCGKVLAEVMAGQPAILNGEFEDAGLDEILFGHPPLRNFLGLPLFSKEEIVGVVGLANRASGYDASVVEFLSPFLRTYASIINAYKNARKRHLAEEALRKNAKRLAEAQRIAHLGSWEWNIQTNSVYWSEELYRIFGLEPEEFGATYEAFLELVHPEDRDRVRLQIETSIKHKAPLERYFRIVRPDGEIRHLHAVSDTELDASGNAIRLIGTSHDLTEKVKAEEDVRESEDRYRRFVEVCPDAIFIVRDGRISYVNEAGVQLLGAESSTEILGKTPYDFTPVRMHPLITQRSEALLKGGKLPLISDKAVRVDGTEIDIELAAAFFTDHGFPCIQIVMRDITDRRRLEVRVQRTSDREKLGMMAGGIAHDFNNILTSILGNSSVIGMDLEKGSPLHEQVQEITRGVDRASGLCRQLLAYCGKAQFNWGMVNLAKLIEEVGPQFESMARPSITFRYKLAPGLPDIEGDAAQIQQVLFGLVENSVEAIGSSAGTITLSVESAAWGGGALAGASGGQDLPAGSYVIMEVSDTGQGMDEETQRRIFDPFFTTKLTGRGLGLSSAIGVVKGHRAHIQVQSALSRGATFRIFFPVPQTLAKTTWPTTQPSQGETRADPKWRGAGTILVIEDEPSVLRLTDLIMKEAGFSTLLVSNATEAVELFSRNVNQIEACIIDWTVAGISGRELMSRIRELKPGAKVILSSGYNLDEMAKFAESDPRAALIQKPYRPQDLLKVLRGLLEA